MADPFDIQPLTERNADEVAASKPAWADAVPGWLESRAGGRGGAVVAYLRGAPVGIAEYVRGDVGEIRNVHVLAEFRNRGIGEALIRVAELWTEAPTVRLRVGLGNDDARRLYARMGYRGTGERVSTTYEFLDDDGARRTATETDEWMHKIVVARERLARQVNTGEPYLRPLGMADAAAVLSAFDSDAGMARQGDVASIEDAKALIAGLRGGHGRHRPWALVVDGTLKALVCVTIDAANKSGWFWYWTHISARGQGWTSRAAATVANWSLAEGGLERLELGHRVNNPASGAVARAAGFIKEGTERGKFLIDGERIDVHTYGRLQADPQPTPRTLPVIMSSCR